MSIGISRYSSGANRFVEQHRRASSQVNKSLERLSTGKRINRASDDPAGLIAAEQIRGEIIDLQAQSRAASYDRYNYRQRQTASTQIANSLNEARGSIVSAADGANSGSQANAIQQEVDSTIDAINQIANGVDGLEAPDSLQALREGGSANLVNGDLNEAAELIEAELSELTQSRAQEAAIEKNEDVFEQLRQDQIVIHTETLSQIEDTDYAAESSNFVEGQILSQASIAALTYLKNEQVGQIEALLDSTA